MSSQVKITKNTGTNSRRWMRILPYQFFSWWPPDSYTSVGNRGNTKPNAALRLVDPGTGLETYRPAYLLHDCMAERQGRL
uniref:Uncharacterized protein n=1 Tax=Daphnia galeata TaxID=27404 RepID=A0A8J2RUF3_9CRUS|nr:unnamed protein product [Daphnia galeata]